MTRNIKATLVLSFLLVTASLTARAGSHLNLSSDPSDFADGERFVRMCVEYNEELPNKEATCQNAWLGYTHGQ